MKLADINQTRLDYLLTIEMSDEQLIKRLYYAKRTRKEEEYYCLMMLRAIRSYNSLEA